MATVDVMIVGSQKSGTSSLLAYLGAHPGILPQRPREMTWFTDASLAASPFPDQLYFGNQNGNGRLRLGKLSGLMYDPAAVERLARSSPAVTAVAILRDPVARAYASYWFARRRGRESRPRFEDAVADGLSRIEAGRDWEDSGSPYLDWSCYAPHVAHLRDTLGADRVHVVILEELVQDPRAELASLMAGLGLGGDGLPPSIPRENRAGVARSATFARARRRAGRSPVAKRLLTPHTREALRRHYRRFNETEVSLPPIEPATEERLRIAFERPNRRLEDLLGRSLEVWRLPS